MPVLKSLSFTALPKTTNDPVQQRRTKFVAKLEEQKVLLQDPNQLGRCQTLVAYDLHVPGTYLDPLCASIGLHERLTLFGE